MESTSADVYIRFSCARDAARRPGQAKVDAPGLHGLLPSSDAPRIRLLATDDGAYDVLSAQLADGRAGMIDVFSAAERCAGLLDGRPGWRSELVTAMVCRDLQTVPAVSLPGELTIRPVRRLADDPPDGVPLKDAVAAAALADPRTTDPGALADYMQSLPPAMRLFVAVDSDGGVRATAGFGAIGSEASVIFVNTDPGWRGRGLGRAMTAAALHAAEQSGARRAGSTRPTPACRSTWGSGSRSLRARCAFSAPADSALLWRQEACPHGNALRTTGSWAPGPRSV